MIYVEVNHNDLEYVRQKLGQKKKDAPRALRDATNDTATQARKMLKEAAQQRYTVKMKGFYSRAKIKRATLDDLTAEIRVSGKPLPLPRFHTTTPKSGAKTEIIRGDGLKTIVGPRRIRAFSGKGKNRLNNLIYQRESVARVPLKPLYGPSIPKMIERVYEGRRAEIGLKENIEERYQANVRRQIERFLHA